MKFKSCWAIPLVFFLHKSFAQKTDSAYIGKYKQPFMITGYFGHSYVALHEDGTTFQPNSKLSIGAGLAIRKFNISVKGSYPVIPLSGSKYGKTKSLDLRVHSYGRNFVIDVTFQSYKGFYQKTKSKTIDLFPKMDILITGVEFSYVFNSKKISMKAAFDQSEKQLKSAGSFIVGGNGYLSYANLQTASQPKNVNNVQFGCSVGYARSFVINRHWTISGMLTLGVNFGNDFNYWKTDGVKFYPTGLGRFAISYHAKDWGISLLSLVHNKTIYDYPNDQTLNITPVNVQLAYTKQFDLSFRKKK